MLCQRQQLAYHSVWVTCETKSRVQLELISLLRAMLAYGIYSQKVVDTPPLSFVLPFPQPSSPPIPKLPALTSKN